jgi:hypothetical protein
MRPAQGIDLSAGAFRLFRAYEWLCRIGTFRLPVCDKAETFTCRGEQDPYGVLANAIRLLAQLPPFASMNHRFLQEAALLLLCHQFAVADPPRAGTFRDCLTAFSVAGMSVDDLDAEVKALLNFLPLHQPHLTVLEVATKVCHEAGGSRELQCASIGCLSFIMRCCEVSLVNPLETASEAVEDVGIALAAVALSLVCAHHNPSKGLNGHLTSKITNLRILIYDCVLQNEQTFRLGCYGNKPMLHALITERHVIETAVSIALSDQGSPVTVQDLG